MRSSSKSPGGRRPRWRRWARCAASNRHTSKSTGRRSWVPSSRDLLCDHELPHVEKRKRIDPETAGLADLLGTALKVRAVEASISPQLLATSADLELFALERGRGAAEKLPILQGWRRQLAGEHLLKVLEGKLTVGYDPETKQVRLFER